MPDVTPNEPGKKLRRSSTGAVVVNTRWYVVPSTDAFFWDGRATMHRGRNGGYHKFRQPQTLHQFAKKVLQSPRRYRIVPAVTLPHEKSFYYLTELSRHGKGMYTMLGRGLDVDMLYLNWQQRT